MHPLTRNDPRRIGPYRLYGRLGSGGMGTVYAAYAAYAAYTARNPQDTLLAIKVVHDEHSSDRDFQTRFVREVDLIRDIQGPHLARFHDADTAAARPWLATELVPGHTLGTYVRRHGPLAGGRLFAFAAATAAALHTIHEHAVIHRDLKPGNVILAEHGPVLLDFGIARATEQTALTRTGVVLGTPGWISPEQYAGRAADAPADLFAWGSLVAFAASGRPPFGEAGAALMAPDAHASTADLSALPPALRPVVTAALARDPEQRPDARQALRAVHGAWQGTDSPDDGSAATAALLAAHWPGVEVPPVPAAPRRGRAVLTVTGTALVSVTAATVLTLTLLSPDSAEESEADAGTAPGTTPDPGQLPEPEEEPHAYAGDWPGDLAVDTAENDGWRARAELRDVDAQTAALFPERDLGTEYAYFEHSDGSGQRAAVAVFDMMSTSNGVESNAYVLPTSTVPVTGEMLVVNHGEQRHTSGRVEESAVPDRAVRFSGAYTIPSRDATLLTFEGPEYHQDGLGAPPVSVCATPGERIPTDDWWTVDYGPGEGFSLDYTDCT
ncbi:protein kinase [Lipingzhangella sp. LS1_29]|uniref:Protein kinase n=1 Tax=Lipingzhangella rawalii TaxID=2055835 RepID=A0ABU2H6W1_9ACTN|nr:protein kinase [Lipingzhangella rawalii]MDS1271047.1 protein kinase [Lipingzhangella rawalii]